MISPSSTYYNNYKLLINTVLTTHIVCSKLPIGPIGQFGETASVTRLRADQGNVRQLSATERERKAATAHALRSTCKVRIAAEEHSGIDSPMCHRFNITCTQKSQPLAKNGWNRGKV